MTPVNLAAAPSGAAILPAAATDGRSPAATGFAAVLANVQATAGGPASTAANADAPADEATLTADPGSKADAQLAAWLTLTRLAQQLTGAAMVSAPADDVKAGARDVGPSPASFATADTARTADTAAADALVVLPVLVAATPTPIVVPANGGLASPLPVSAFGEPGAANAELQELTDGTSADLKATVMTALDEAVDADVVPQVQTNAELASTAPVDQPSIKALLAELKHAVAPSLAGGPSESSSTPAPGTDTPTALAAAVGQVMLGRSGPGEQRGSGDANRERAAADKLLDGKAKPSATGLARAIAARFMANEGEAPAGAAVAAPTGGRAVTETVEVMKPAAAAKSDGAGAAAFMALPASMSAVAVTGRTTVVPVAATAIAGEVASELHNQIIQGMRMQVTAGGGDAQIRLQPEYLGDLSISLKVENGAVTARLAASSADVRQWIEANEPLLRQSLAQQDLRLEKLVVAEDEPASPNRDQEPAQEQAGHQPRPRRRRPETEATFEVVV